MKIVLKDGTEIQNSMVGKTENYIELTMPKEDALKHISKFMDPEIMSEIKYYSGAWITIYSGFNRFMNMDNSKDNEMLIWMRGSDDATVNEPIARFSEEYMPKGE